MINRGATLVSRLAMLCAVLFALAACGGGGGGGGTFFDEDDDTPVNPPVTQNYTLALTLQDATGSAATSLAQSATGTLKILVTDDNNSAIPVAGALVSVQVTAGAVSPTSGITDENGLLTLQITAGSELGAVEITASTSINDETYTGVLNYQVVEFVPYLLQLTLLGPDEQPTTALAKDTQGTLQAKVISADGSGEPIANVLVNAGTSIGSLVPANGQALTNSSGIASFAVVAGSTVGAGAITTTAQIGDITFNNALNFQVTDETQTVSYFLSLTLLDSDDQPTNSLTKDKQGTLQAKVTSGSINGTPVPGVVVSANTNIGTLAPSNGRSLSDSNGVATFVVSAGSIIGAGTLSATLQIGDVTLNRSLNFQIADGVISITPYFVELTLLGPDGQPTTALAKNTQGTLRAKITSGSENGTPVANELVSASATVGSLASGQALSNSSGFANFTVVAGTTIAAGSATATIQIGGNTYTDSVNYEVVDNIPYTLELTLLGPDGQPTTTLAKNTQGTVQAKVTSTDGSNTPAVGVVVNTSSTVGILVPNGPALSDSNGVATYTIAAGSTIAAGTLTASVQIGGATFADTLNFEVVNAISYSLELTLLGPDGQPTTTLAKNTQGTLQAKVTANDGSNTPVVGALVNASTTVGSLVPASQALSDGNGVATFAVVAGSTIAAGAVTASVEIDGDTFSDTLNFEVINPILYSLELTLLGPDGQPTTKLSKNTQGTLQAKVTAADGSNTPVVGVLVDASTTVGILVPSNGQSLSNSAGVATFTVTAGSVIAAGAVTANVQIDGDTFTDTFNFEVVDSIPYLLELTLLGPDGQPTTSLAKNTQGTLQAKVTATDGSNTPVVGALVNASTTIGSLVPASQALSDSNGVATFAVVAGPTISAGAVTANVQIDGDTFTDTVNFEIVDSIPYLLELTLLGPDGQPTTTLAKNTQGTLQAKVTTNDGSNTPVVGELVSAGSTIGSLVPGNGQALSDSSGIATFTVVAGSTVAAGAVTADVQIGDNTFTDVLNFEIVDSIPYQLELTLLGPDGQPTTTLAKNTQGTLQAKVTTTDGNNTPAVGVLVNASTTVGSLVPASQALSDSNGVATFAVVAGSTIAAGAVTADVQIGDDTFSDSLNFEVIENELYVIELTLLAPDGQPTSALANNTQGTLQARITTDSGDPVANTIVNAATTFGSLIPGNGQVLTNASGIATFTVVAGANTGAGVLTGTVEISGNAFSDTLNFEVIEGELHFVQLTLLGPDGQPTIELAENTQGTLQATITSESGDPVANVIVNATTTFGSLLPGNGQVLTNASGVATFTVVAGANTGAGVLTGSVEIGGNSFSDSLNFEVIENELYVIELTLLAPDGQPTSALANNTQGTLQARVSTESGSPVSNVIVNATTTFGNLVPANGQVLTDAGGIATFTVVAGANTGAGVLTGGVEIGGNAFSDTLNFEVIEGELHFVQLTLLGPDGQPTSALANNTQGTLLATITTESGDPVANVIVNAATTFGSLVPSNGQALTNASGVATFTVVAGANTGAGVLTGSVEIGGNTFNDSLNFEVIEGELHFVQLTLLGPDGLSTNELTEDTQGTLQARITTESGDPVANVIVNATTTFGSLVPGNGQSLTDASGIATFRVEAGASAGAGVITGSVQIGGNTFTNTLNFKVVGDELYFVTLTLLDSDGQATTAITERTEGSLQILVTRDSESGSPVAGVIVNAAAQLGTLEPANGLTNSLGIVTLKYSAGLVIGAGELTASTVIAGDTFTGTLNFEVTRRIRKLGYFDANNVFIENQILVIPATTLSAGGDAQLTVAILDENDERITRPEEVVFSSGCIAAAQSTINPTNPVSVYAQASTLYSAVNCSGTDDITASIAGTDAQAFGTLEIAAPETNSINFVSAEPLLIVLRGTGGVGRDETSDVVFQVMDQSGRPLPGVSVELGLSTRVGGLALSTDVGNQNGSAISNGDGEVFVTVQAGNVATAVRVLASVDDGDGNLVTTVSDLITVTTGIPDQNSISLSVSEFVVPNAGNRDGVTATLTVRMADRFNNPVVAGTAAVFTTEYGIIEGSCTTDDAGACSVIWTSSEPRFPLSGTADIKTIKNTACPDFIGQNFVPCPSELGYTRGLRSAILVHAIGEESFVDSNGNGQMDQDELYENISEAFNDHNEDSLFTPVEVCDTDPASAQCQAGIEETFVDFNSNGLFDIEGPSPLFNGLSCPVEGDGDWCSRTLLNVWDSVDITLSDDTSWAVVMVRDNVVVTRTVTGALQMIYISDEYNNPPPAGSTVTLSTSGNCEIVGETDYSVPALQSQGAFGLPVRTKPLDSPPTNPEFGTFSVNFNPAQGVPVRWVYDCDTPPPPAP